MTLARFKDLCMDVTDSGLVGNFWAKILGQRVEPQENGDANVYGRAFPPIWLNQVPEAKAVKNRVHLDLEVIDIDLVASVGATVLSRSEDWAVLADPEGNELCATPGQPSPAVAQVFALCVDAERPVELAAWWQSVLGGSLVPAPDGEPRWLMNGAGLGDLTWKFVPVPDVRSVKNRCHWDVSATDVQALVDAGATVVRAPDDAISWTVLADPEGNEFCVHQER